MYLQNEKLLLFAKLLITYIIYKKKNIIEKKNIFFII